MSLIAVLTISTYALTQGARSYFLFSLIEQILVPTCDHAKIKTSLGGSVADAFTYCEEESDKGSNDYSKLNF